MVLVLLLIFLVPVAIYCLVLAGINRCARPIMLSGLADTLGLLFALSGFLFVVGPQIVHGLFEGAMDRVPLDMDTATYEKWLDTIDQWWDVFFVGYYVVVALGIIWLLWRSESKTVVYNIELSAFEREFMRVLDRLGLAGQRSAGGRTYVLRDAGHQDAPAAMSALPLAEAPAITKRYAELQFEYFPALYHLTLHWRSTDGDAREAVEAELATAFQHVEMHDNSASWWFLGVGGSCIGVIFIIVVLLVLLAYLT